MSEVPGKLVSEKLIPLLQDEFNLERDVQKKLVSVKKKLEQMQAYLKDADKQAESGESRKVVKVWVKQMREISFSLEDAMDEYLFKMENNKLEEKDRCGIIGAVASYIYDFLRGIMPRHKVSGQLLEIEESLRKLEDDKRTYKISPESNSGGGSHSSSLHSLRQRALSIGDEELVGVKPTKQKLINWLLEGQSPRTVIAVVGQGGLGKTTVVNKVFKELKEGKNFDCRAVFITVSHSFRRINVLKSLIEQFNKEAGNEKVITISSEDRETDMEEKLRNYLKGKNYMIVFDDVWEESFWGEVEFALPKEMGRIIITIRHNKVALVCETNGSFYTHSMKELDSDAAWDLFCCNAFRKACPENLRKMANKFVKKCKGVPLSIVAIARLLFTKGEDCYRKLK